MRSIVESTTTPPACVMDGAQQGRIVQHAPRPPAAPRTRPLIFLTLSVAAGLMLAPAVTAQFVWRYQLPFVVLVPMAAALAVVRLRTPVQSGSPGTAPTPSTDWPNGGLTRRSSSRVVGTTSRS
jgi:hypothetical protein